MTRRALAFALSLLAAACATPTRSAPTRAIALTPVLSPPTVRAEGAPASQPVSSSVAVAVTAQAGDSVWLVHADGRASRTWPPAGRAPIVTTVTTLDGSDGLALAPDGTRVAYVQDRALWIEDLAGSAPRLVARAGKKDEALLLTDWSPDGTELMYATMQDYEPFRGARFRWDLATGKSTRFEIQGEAPRYLGTGELLVSAHHALHAVRGRTTRTVVQGSTGQVSLHPDGVHLATLLTVDEASSQQQLVRIDVRTGEVTPVGARSAYAEVQWPAYSPSGKKLATIVSVRTAGQPVQRRVRVESTQVDFADAGELVDYRWIDDDTLVEIVEQNDKRRELVVVTTGGQVKGRTTLR